MHDEQLTTLIDKMLKYDEFKMLFASLNRETLTNLTDNFDSDSFRHVCTILDIDIAAGASRIVIIPRHDDCVYKVNANDVNRDYCRMEYNVYTDAAATSLKSLFAEVEPVDAIHYKFAFPDPDELTRSSFNYRDCVSVSQVVKDFMDDWDVFEGILEFYRAEKIEEPFDEYGNSGNSDNSEEADNCHPGHEGISDFVYKSRHTSPLAETLCVGERFYRDYGDLVFEQLSRFLQAHEVDDLHEGNVGYTDGHIRLLDYCGYYNC